MENTNEDKIKIWKEKHNKNLAENPPSVVVQHNAKNQKGSYINGVVTIVEKERNSSDKVIFEGSFKECEAYCKGFYDKIVWNAVFSSMFSPKKAKVDINKLSLWIAQDIKKLGTESEVAKNLDLLNKILESDSTILADAISYMFEINPITYHNREVTE